MNHLVAWSLLSFGVNILVGLFLILGASLYKNYLMAYDRELPYSSKITYGGLLIVVLLLFALLMSLGLLAGPTIVESEINEYIAFSNECEILMNTDNFLIDYDLIKKIQKSNKWLERAKKNKEKIGPLSFFYDFEVEKLQYIDLPQKAD